MFRRMIRDYFRLYGGFYVAGIFMAHFLDFTGWYWSEVYLTMYMVQVLFLFWLTCYYYKNRMVKDGWRGAANLYGLIPFSFLIHSVYWISPDNNLLASVCLFWGLTSFMLPFVIIRYSINSPRKQRYLWMLDMRRRNAEEYKNEKRREWHPRCRKVRHRVYPSGINQTMEGF